MSPLEQGVLGIVQDMAATAEIVGRERLSKVSQPNPMSQVVTTMLAELGAVTAERGRLEKQIADMGEVVRAAKCIHHWHDSSEGGVVVSGEHVFKLWAALKDLEAKCPK